MASEDIELFTFLKKENLRKFPSEKEEYLFKNFNLYYKNFVEKIKKEIHSAILKKEKSLSIHVVVYKKYRSGITEIPFPYNYCNIEKVEYECNLKLINMAVDMFSGTHSLIEDAIPLNITVENGYPLMIFSLEECYTDI